MTVVNLAIATGNDQGQQAGDSGAVSLGASTVSIRNNATDGTRRHLGLRFAVTTIPKGSTINSAIISLTGAHSTIDDLRCDIYGHDVDASDSFEASSGDPTVFQRTRTTATTNWVEANTVINVTSTKDVTAIVQEIVDRASWAETEITLLFICSPSFSDNYQAYGYGGTTPPALDIDFTAPAGVSGTLTKTLDSVTSSGAGNVGTFSLGTLTKTLDALTASSAGTVESLGGPAVPTITPNTADAYDFGADTTPTIEFTGDDTDTGETLRYNIQISETNTFSTTSSITKQNIETDTGTVHANNISGSGTEDDRPGNSFLGSGGILDKINLKLGIQGTPEGYYYIKIYEIQGTFGTDAEPLNAADRLSTPTPGHIAISDGWYVHTSTLTTTGVEKTITFSGANRILLENGHPYYFILNYVGTGDTSNAPFCSVTTAHTYEGDCYNDGQSVNNGYVTAWEVWFKLYEAPFLLDKVSGTDAGFLNTVNAGNLEPFDKNQKISYTVQAGEALRDGTYYWRARAIDPSGSNTYSSWTTTRSFTVDAFAYGTSSPTLGSLTSTSSGTVAFDSPITGTLSKGLDALTSSSAGTNLVSATSSPTLEALTVDSSATNLNEGALSTTLESLSVISSADLLSQATLSSNLDNLSTSSVGNIPIAGTSAKTLDQLSTISSGDVGVTGTTAKTLESLVVSSLTTVSLSGLLSTTLEALTVVANSSSSLSATLIKTLDSLTSSAIGDIIVSGNTARTLDNLSVISDGDLPLVASLTKTLESLTVDSTGNLPLVGALSKTLEPLTVDSTIGIINFITGTLEESLGSLVVSSQADVVVNGVTSKTLEAVSVSSSADVALVGGVSATLAPLTVVASSQSVSTATLLETLDSITIISLGDVDIRGVLASTLSSLGVASSADALISGVSSNNLGILQSSASGIVNVEGVLSATLDSISVVASSESITSGTVSKALGGLVVVSSGDVLLRGTVIESLADLSVDSSGFLTTIVSEGVLSATLGQLTLTASSQLVSGGRVQFTLDSLSVNTTGTVSLSGSVDKTLALLGRTISGTVLNEGGLSTTLEGIDSTVSGDVIINSTLNRTLDGISTSISGRLTVTGTLDETLAGVTRDISGNVLLSGTTSKILEAIDANVIATVLVNAASQKVLDDLTAHGHIINLDPGSGFVTATLEDLVIAVSGGVQTWTRTFIVEAKIDMQLVSDTYLYDNLTVDQEVDIGSI